MEKLEFVCPTIRDGGEFPLEHTGKGDDYSPAFYLKNLSPQAKSLALTLVDLDSPIKRELTHWLVWNIPASSYIPARFSHGFEVVEPQGARQGIAYGWHCYAGPNPPLGQDHTYQFTIYSLDSYLELGKWTYRRKLLKAIEGHTLQKGQLKATFGDKKIWRRNPNPAAI